MTLNLSARRLKIADGLVNPSHGFVPLPIFPFLFGHKHIGSGSSEI